MDLELLQHEVGQGDRRVVELQPPVPRFLAEQDVVAELELVEEDVHVEAVAPLVVPEPPVPEDPVAHPARSETEAFDDRPDGSGLAPVPLQAEVGEQATPLP